LKNIVVQIFSCIAKKVVQGSNGSNYLYEFIDGFEFEVYSEGYWEDSIEDFCGWYEYKFGYNNWRDIDEIERELKLENIQVWCGKI